MNVLILAASKGTEQRTQDALPFCLLETDGGIVLERLTVALEPLQPDKLIFAFMKHDIDQWGLDYVVDRLAPNPIVISVEKATAGATCTALLAMPYINNEDELLIVSANEIIRQDLCAAVSDFRKRKLDAGVFCFPSVHPRYAYVRLDNANRVMEAREKKPISRNAIPGFFWFAHGQDFVRGAQENIRKDAKVQDVFYISSTLNEMILENANIGVFHIDADQYIPLKTDRQREYYESFNATGRAMV